MHVALLPLLDAHDGAVRVRRRERQFLLDVTTVQTAERMSVVEERGELVAWGDLVPTSMHQSALRPPAIRFRRPVASEGTGGRTKTQRHAYLQVQTCRVNYSLVLTQPKRIL